MKKRTIISIIILCLAIALGLGGGYAYVHMTNPPLKRETLEKQMEQKLSEEAEKLVEK